MTDDLIRREAALEALGFAAWKHEGADAYSQGMDAGARHQAKQDYEAIRAIPAAQVQAEPVAIDCDLGMACHFPRMEVYYSEAERNMAQAELVTGTPITMTYRNHRGEVNLRRILPTRIWFGSTDWHPEPGWIMSAYDLAKAEHRDFALADCQFANLSTAPTKSPDDLDSLVQRLRAPAYWMSGSYAEHEGENNAPQEAATAITTLRNKLALANIDAEYLAEALTRAQYWIEGSRDRHEPVVASAREAIEAHNKRLEVENDHRNDA